MEIISIYSRTYLTDPDGECIIVLCKVLYQYIVIASYKSGFECYTPYADTFTFDTLEEATEKFEELQG